MKRTILSLILLCSACVCFAQTNNAERDAFLDANYAKYQKLDLYNQILPVLMSKDQLRQLLPMIEKVRQRVSDTLKAEYTELKPLDADMDQAIKDAEAKGTMPSHEFMRRVFAAYGKINGRRELMAQMNTNDVYDVFVKVLNAGQVTVAANALDPKFFNPKAKVEEMKTEDKVRLYVRQVLLNPMAYPILVQMSN